MNQYENNEIINNEESRNEMKWRNIKRRRRNISMAIMKKAKK